MLDPQAGHSVEEFLHDEQALAVVMLEAQQAGGLLTEFLAEPVNGPRGTVAYVGDVTTLAPLLTT